MKRSIEEIKRANKPIPKGRAMKFASKGGKLLPRVKPKGKGKDY